MRATRVALPEHLASDDCAGIAAEVGIGPVHPLHGEAQWPAAVGRGEFDAFQMRDQGGAIVPGHFGSGAGEVQAGAGGHRDGGEAGKAHAFGNSCVFIDDGAEAGFVEIDQVHLVHGQHDVANAHQRGDEAVAAGLRQQALGGIDQDDGEIGGGGAGGHVAGILFVAGRIGDNEAAARGGEEAPGDIDGDALLAFGLQPVEQQRIINLAAGGAMLAAVIRQRAQRVVHDGLAVVQQAADQRGLAVVY